MKKKFLADSSDVAVILRGWRRLSRSRWAPGWPFPPADDERRKKIRLIYGDLSEFYDPLHEWEQARKDRDPHSSPHGMLRGLALDNAHHAKEFLEAFGPLFLEPDRRLAHGPSVSGEIDLSAFWSLQLRFRLVTDLFAACRQPTGVLKEAFCKIAQNTPRIREGLANFFPPGVAADGADAIRRFATPWEQRGKDVEHWLAGKNARELVEAARAFVHNELNTHTRTNENVWIRQDGRFERDILFKSLWSLVWEMFALDTAGNFWRVCPHCSQLFYPSRENQRFCTTEVASLMSKREWWRRRGKKWREHRQRKTKAQRKK